jgi:mRNA interferase RelE/StbE
VREYTVVFARSARKELQALDRGVAGRILKRIEALTREPRPSGCKKLEGTDKLWRIRVGDWRVVYAVDDAKTLVEVSVIRHRREVYR